MKRAICIFVLAFQLAGCTTMNFPPYTAGTPAPHTIRIGDQVDIPSWTDGERHTRRLLVTSMTSDEICGEGGCVRREDVDRLQREDLRRERTGLAVIVTAIALPVIVASAFRRF